MKVSYEEADKYADEINASYLETSAKNNTNIDEILPLMTNGLYETGKLRVFYEKR